MGDQTLLRPSSPRLVLITQRQRIPGERFFAVVEQALAGGVDAVLVREKDMDSARLLAFAARLREITRNFRAKLIVHTQADVARAVGADGVHVAADDLVELPAMRAWLDDDCYSLSASCHSAAELALARHLGADFALLSPVFPTQSHPQSRPLGVSRFKKLAASVRLPVLALGGITPANRAQLAGFGVAVIGAIFDAPDARAAAAELRMQR